jgi:hypothetical protein
VIGNGAPEFKVIYTESVRETLRMLVQRARAAGRAGHFLAALKALDRNLKFQPHSFGETLYTLKQAKLEVRVGGEDFLSVRFGVHLEKKLVIVIECHVLGDPGF